MFFIVGILLLLSGSVSAGEKKPWTSNAPHVLPVSTVGCPVCHQSGGRMITGKILMEGECTGCHTDMTVFPRQVSTEKQQKGTQTGSRNTTAMVKIPGGPFIIGYDHRHPDEKPAHTMTIHTFYIDLYEVTNEQYKNFVDATHRRPPDDWIDGHYSPEKKKHPVVFVTWYDARDYCAWAKKRLPSEEEWEKAARGTDGRLYPWGNEFNPKKANTPQSHSVGTTPVGSYPQGRSPYGVYDMSGNVWEWTESWAKPYPGSPIPTGHYFTGEYKVLKGGSWVDCSFYRCGISALTFNRGYFRPLTKNQGFGFRCAKDG